MNALLNLFRDMAGYLADGGLVMLPLMAATVALWYGLGYRIVHLRRGSKKSLRTLIKDYQVNPHTEARGYICRAVLKAVRVQKDHKGDIHEYLEESLFGLSEEMRKYRALVRTIVLVAPLAGLLGTVSGMIEMFDSIGSQTFYSQTGGIANGISQALFTTQFGLVVAIPGMIIGRYLDKTEDGLREEFEQIKEYFNGTPLEGERNEISA